MQFLPASSFVFMAVQFCEIRFGIWGKFLVHRPHPPLADAVLISFHLHTIAASIRPCVSLVLSPEQCFLPGVCFEEARSVIFCRQFLGDFRRFSFHLGTSGWFFQVFSTWESTLSAISRNSGKIPWNLQQKMTNLLKNLQILRKSWTFEENVCKITRKSAKFWKFS